MIPFGTQRGLGQDLATHLMNTHDNEHMELVSVRGAVAKDLNGAFAEWEVQAHSMTKCRNYLYSLSINPDPEQAPLTRDQYEDYIERVEDKLGLTGQPRAIVFHIKNGREHAHVVWSRIDAEAGKAVQMAFDREKLMMVTREFALDHGLSLPQGYDRDGKSRDQLSLYEKAQQEKTGVTKEERLAHVTEAWRQSDSAKTFVRALEERGYILATGKRPYVLVDIYGEMNALPKLIADKTIRAKDVQTFLSKDFPTDSLPKVEEARKLTAQHRKAREAFVKSQRNNEALKVLQEKQASRREAVQKEAATLKARQAAEQMNLAAKQQDELKTLERRFKGEIERINHQREANKPTGLAAFLGRVTGVNFVIKKLQERSDRMRAEARRQEKIEFLEQQSSDREEFAFRQRMQGLAQERRSRALDRLDAREMRSVTTKMLRDERAQGRDGFVHLPTLGRERPPKEVEHSGDDGYYIDIHDHFTRAAGEGKEGGGGDDGGDSSGRDYRSVFGKGHGKNTGKPGIGKDKGSGKDKGEDIDR